MGICQSGCQFSSVQLLSCVLLFATPWTAACQASFSITNAPSLLKVMAIESVMPSSNLILCCHLLLLPSVFPNIRVFFPISQFFASGGQSIGVSASASVLSMNIQGWFPSGLTGLISGTNHILRAPSSWSNYFPTVLPHTNIILRVKISKSELWEDTFSP